MKLVVCGLLLSVAACCSSAQEKTDEVFSRKNTWTVFAEDSGTSSHILMGSVRHRELIDLGFGYTRRVLRFRGTSLGYHAEIRPALFESDPVTIDNYTQTTTYPGQPPFTYSGQSSTVGYGTCQPGTTTSTFAPPPADPGQPTFTIVDNIACGRQWTAGQAFSPLGFKYSMRTRHALQPFFVGTLGYMYTSRPVPVAGAESFNFLFSFGPGIELYRSGRRSISVEYRFSHFSNRDTAPENPGTDNMMLKVSYSFGR